MPPVQQLSITAALRAEAMNFPTMPTSKGKTLIRSSGVASAESSVLSRHGIVLAMCSGLCATSMLTVWIEVQIMQGWGSHEVPNSSYAAVVIPSCKAQRRRGYAPLRISLLLTREWSRRAKAPNKALRERLISFWMRLPWLLKASTPWTHPEWPFLYC